MFKNKNKGFVLMEAIVVIVVITVSLLTLFMSYNKILTKVKEENKYDLSEYLYKTNFIRKYLSDNNCVANIYSIGTAEESIIPIDYNKDITCNGISIDIEKIFSVYNVKKIYILKDINGANTNNNLIHFDSYMIDYIKQLDVDDNDSLIIVEYGKVSRDNNYNPLNIYEYDPDDTIDDVVLEETYFASLEW